MLGRAYELRFGIRAHERLEGGLVNFFSFVDVDRAAYVSVETRVEETGRIFQRRALGEGKLHPSWASGLPGRPRVTWGHDCMPKEKEQTTSMLDARAASCRLTAILRTLSCKNCVAPKHRTTSERANIAGGEAMEQVNHELPPASALARQTVSGWT
jgi:hypothetical protein